MIFRTLVLGVVGIKLNYFPRSFVSSFTLVGQLFTKIRAPEQPFDVKLQKKGLFRHTCVFRNSRVTFHVSLFPIYFWAFESLYINNLLKFGRLKTNTFSLEILPKPGVFEGVWFFVISG